MNDSLTIFLTGGTGFIGSYFLESIMASPVEVRALRRSPQSKCKRALDREPEWIDKKMDELEPADFEACDVLVHLASPGVSPQKATGDELLYWNVVALEKMLAAAAKAGVRRYVLAGTFAEYGRAAEDYEYIPKDCNLVPTTAYAASKAAAWMVAQAFAIEKQVELVWLRIFSAYGEGQHHENFWPSLKTAALAGEDFKMSPGEQIRDYIEVGEVVKAFKKAALELDLVRGIPMQYNIGSGQPVTMRQFAAKFWDQWDAKGQLLVGALPYRSNEVMRFVPDPLTLLPKNSAI